MSRALHQSPQSFWEQRNKNIAPQETPPTHPGLKTVRTHAHTHAHGAHRHTCARKQIWGERRCKTAAKKLIWVDFLGLVVPGKFRLWCLKERPGWLCHAVPSCEPHTDYYIQKQGSEGWSGQGRWGRRGSVHTKRSKHPPDLLPAA